MFMKSIPGGVEIDVPWSAPEGWDSHAVIEPDMVFIPMAQGPGDPCSPVVKAGDRVREGQIICEADTFVSAYAHASVSGTVREIAEKPQANGKKTVTVIIENDGRHEMAEPLPPAEPTDAEQLRETIRNAGIVGMGGAGFPSHVKVEGGRGKIDRLILNGSECEPLLRADATLMSLHAERILAGCRIVMAATGAPKAMVGIESNKPEALGAMRRAVQGFTNMEIRELPHIYPMGGEKQLIKALTGREVPIGGLPSDAGLLVLNVATAFAVAEAVQRSKTLVRRLCTVAGDVVNPMNMVFPVGTPVKDALTFCGGMASTASRVIVGGPMMGRAVDRLDVPLTKTSGGLVVINQDHDGFRHSEYPCIRCSRCSRACPMALMPQDIDRAFRVSDVRACERLQATTCINCGGCTYVCPSHIPLAANIVTASQKVKEHKGKNNG